MHKRSMPDGKTVQGPVHPRRTAYDQELSGNGAKIAMNDMKYKLEWTKTGAKIGHGAWFVNLSFYIRPQSRRFS